jgi:hypothetical protein
VKQTAQQNGNLLMCGKTDQVGSQMSSAVNGAEHAACQLCATPCHICDPTLDIVHPVVFLAQILQSPCQNALLCAGKGVSKLSKKQSGQRWKVALEALQKVNLHLEV